MSVRVYELAKELGVESMALVDWFKEHGVMVRSASTPITPDAIRLARESFRTSSPIDPSRVPVTRGQLRQGWVGSVTQLGRDAGVARPAPSDDLVHAHTEGIPDVSLCGRKLRYTDLRAWPPKPGGNEPCPVCWHEAEKLPPSAPRPNNPFR